MGKLVSIETLPFALQQYARGEEIVVSKRDWSEKEWLLARWHRRAFFRNLQRERPGSQYMWEDYQFLMRDEIMRYANRSLAKKCLLQWRELLAQISGLHAMYIVELRRVLKNNPRPRMAKKRHLLREARRQTLRRGFYDPRTLGAIEMFVHNEVRFGIPPTSNYFE